MTTTAHTTQNDLIIDRLRKARGGEVSMLELSQASDSLNVHSRIDELRKRGHNIPPARKINQGKRIHSYYRLIED